MPRPKKQVAHCRRAYRIRLEKQRQQQQQQQQQQSSPPRRRSMRLFCQQPHLLLESCSCFPIFTCEDCMKRAAEVGDVSTARFRRDEIGGEGLRAQATIEAGTFVIEYRGKRSKKRISGPYVLEVSKPKIWIDGAVGGNDSRFINHSCHPNCIIYTEPSSQRPMVFASKRIGVGEELTLKYSNDLPFKCFCETCTQK